MRTALKETAAPREEGHCRSVFASGLREEEKTFRISGGQTPVSLRGDTREEGGATAVRLACLFREEKTDGPNVLEAVGGLERNAFDHRAVQAQIVQFPRAQCA